MPLRLCIHFPKKHLHTEQEQNDTAGHFERVHVNTDRVENDLADGPGGHEDDGGVDHTTERSPMPLSPGEPSGQPGEKRDVPDWIDRRPKGSKIFANLDEERRHGSERCGSALHERPIKRQTNVHWYSVSKIILHPNGCLIASLSS